MLQNLFTRYLNLFFILYYLKFAVPKSGSLLWTQAPKGFSSLLTQVRPSSFFPFATILACQVTLAL